MRSALDDPGRPGPDRAGIDPRGPGDVSGGIMEFRIADTFTDSLARLTGDEQKAVKTTAFDLQLDPANPAMSFHKLAKAMDRRFWSVRVSSNLRSIVHRSVLNGPDPPLRMLDTLTDDGLSGADALPRRLPGPQGVHPPKPGEAREIGVAGAELGAVLDREGREVRVADQVAGHSAGREQPAQHDRVPIPGMHHGRTGLCEPRLDDIEGAFPGERPDEDARVRAQAPEGTQDASAERDRLGPAELPLEPDAGLAVAGELRVDRVEKQVGVDEPHLRSSSSRMASSSSSAAASCSALSTETPARSPMGWVCWRNGRRRARPVPRPARTAWFRACLNEIPRSRATFLSMAVTSGSSVTVVRMNAS